MIDFNGAGEEIRTPDPRITKANTRLDAPPLPNDSARFSEPERVSQRANVARIWHDILASIDAAPLLG